MRLAKRGYPDVNGTVVQTTVVQTNSGADNSGAPQAAGLAPAKEQNQPTTQVAEDAKTRYLRRIGHRAYRVKTQNSHRAYSLGLRTTVTLRNLEFDTLAFLKRTVPVRLNCREVDEDVPTTVDRDEAVALIRVEPFDGALSHETTTP